MTIAERLNLSRGLLSNYEQGRRAPDYETLILIANFFEVSIDYLLGVTDIKKRFFNNDEERNYRKLARDISGLSLQSISELEQYIGLLKMRDRINEKKDAKSSVLRGKE